MRSDHVIFVMSDPVPVPQSQSNGRQPAFTTWHSAVYRSELITACIQRRGGSSAARGASRAPPPPPPPPSQHAVTRHSAGQTEVETPRGTCTGVGTPGDVDRGGHPGRRVPSRCRHTAKDLLLYDL